MVENREPNRAPGSIEMNETRTNEGKEKKLEEDEKP